jgi:hypothetical protein
VEYHKKNGTVQVLGENQQKNRSLLSGETTYAKRTAITVLTNKEKNADFILQRCKMIVEIGLVSL